MDQDFLQKPDIATHKTWIDEGRWKHRDEKPQERNYPAILIDWAVFSDRIVPQDETASLTSNQTKIDEATDASDSNPSYGSHDVPVSFNIHGLLDIERDSSHVTLYI